MSVFARFCRDERGESAIEYALIGGIVACIIINALQGIGTRMSNKFSSIKNALS